MANPCPWVLEVRRQLIILQTIPDLSMLLPDIFRGVVRFASSTRVMGKWG
jgi:hypothetical protein